MAREINRLTAQSVKSLTKPGRYADGDNLYLSIPKHGAGRWVLLYRLKGRQREMGLGSLRSTSLSKARDKARAANALLRDGIDPLTRKHAAAKGILTFAQCAAQYIAAHKPGWKNEKHIQQWENTLRDYVNPEIGEIAIAEIETADVLRVVSPIWQSKNETASRIRGRIEQVIDWATAHEYREGDNPARWRGHMQKLLPKAKSKRRRHHPALPYKDAPAFMVKLAEQDGIAAKALAFTILTAARTVETTGARFDEIDEKEAIWTVPAERMKAGVEHRVPLTSAALAIVREMKRLAEYSGGLVFPGGRRGKPLSENGMLALLKRIDRDDITVHGFRSTFRDWAAETTNHAREVAEQALAHVIESETEAAYRRGELMEKRRILMVDWAAFLGYTAGGTGDGEPDPVDK